MNPIFILLVFLAGGFVWLLSSFAYRTIGKVSGKLVEDAKDAMFKEDDKEKEENKEENKEKKEGEEK